MKCVANNKPCSESTRMRHTVDQNFGNCFSFNYNQPVTTGGTTYGIQIWFNLEVYDTMGMFTSNSGLKLYVTSPGRVNQYGDVFVDLSSEINLSPGFDHSVSVRPRTINKLPHPFSSCQLYKEGTFKNYNTKRECEADCLGRFVCFRCFNLSAFIKGSFSSQIFPETLLILSVNYVGNFLSLAALRANSTVCNVCPSTWSNHY